MTEPDREQLNAAEASRPVTITNTKDHDPPAEWQLDPLAPQPERWTDLGNSRLLVRHYGDRMRWVPGWDRWLVWDEIRWAYDDTGQILRWAKTIARSLLDRAGAYDGDEKKAAVKWALISEGAPRIHSMVELARTEAGIPVLPARLDADPWLLNCPNGTLDLRTGQLRRHDPGDLLTKSTGVPYRVDAPSPLFGAFLARIQPDADMRDYLRRLFGHTLVGQVIEHILAIAWGIGNNGKTTLCEIARAALGDYGGTAERNLLLTRRDGIHPTGVADLHGLRLVIASETDDGAQLAEGLIKSLTGGDRIKARRLYQDFFEFDPSHSLFLYSNHRPQVRGTDLAIWRRLRLIPFPVVIPDAEVDGRLPHRLREELPGVLAWLVAGCLDWQIRGGLDDPVDVLASTSNYRAEQDHLGAFLDERCVLGPLFTVRAGVLREAYLQWCKGNGVEPLTGNQLAERLREHRIEPFRDHHGRGWRGVGVSEL